MNGAVGMEEAGGGVGDLHWFTGLPVGAWLTIAAALLCVGLVCLALTLAGMAKQSDLRVRGWERRQMEAEDQWWMREYPQHEDELPGLEGRHG